MSSLDSANREVASGATSINSLQATIISFYWLPFTEEEENHEQQEPRPSDSSHLHQAR